MTMDIPWDSVEHEAPGIFDEAYLAGLRKNLLISEKEGVSVSINFLPIIPAWAKSIENETLQNHYEAAFNHAKRRLKNCKAVTGWTLEELKTSC